MQQSVPLTNKTERTSVSQIIMKVQQDMAGSVILTDIHQTAMVSYL